MPRKKPPTPTLLDVLRSPASYQTIPGVPDMQQQNQIRAPASQPSFVENIVSYYEPLYLSRKKTYLRLTFPHMGLLRLAKSEQ